MVTQPLGVYTDMSWYSCRLGILWRGLTPNHAPTTSFAHLCARFGRQKSPNSGKNPKMVIFAVLGTGPGRSELSSAYSVGPFGMVCEGL